MNLLNSLSLSILFTLVGYYFTNNFILKIHIIQYIFIEIQFAINFFIFTFIMMKIHNRKEDQ
jgi:hypothetical protein